MSGGGGGGTQTVQQQADPWGGVQPYLQKGYQQADALFQQGGPDYYPGQTYVNRDPMENAGAQAALNYGMSQGPRQYGMLSDAQQQMLNAPDVANNPYVGGILDAGYSRLDDNFTNTIAPNIRDQAFAHGQLGQEGHALAYGQAAEGLADAKADMAAQVYSDTYGQGLDQQYRGFMVAPQVNQAGLMPAQAMSAFGEYNRGEQELALQDAMARFNYNEQSPYANLNNYMGMLQGAPWGSTSTSNVQGGSGSRLAGGLGGAMAGYAAAPMIGSAMGMVGPAAAALGPWGLLGGAALGALMA